MKFFIKFLFLFALLGVMDSKVYAADYYWVGGSGNWSDINHWRTSSGGNILPAVVPGQTDNVFFDSNSGFGSTSKTVTVNVVANCHNITFSGSSVAPTILSSTSTNTLNIYGSSEWQSGMTYGVVITNYQNNNEPRTIKSNGVITGNSIVSGTVNFYETQSISLLDDFSVKYHLYQYAGTWNTNNYRVDIGNSFVSQSTTQVKTINLGSSNIYMNGSISSFDTRAINTVLNSGTSVIHFTAVVTITSSSYGIMGLAGQTYYDVVFENALSTGVAIGSGGTSVNPLNFHNVELKGGGYIYDFNKYNQFILAPGKTFYLENGTTQTITSLFSLNTPLCGGWSTFRSMSDGSVANISMPSGSSVQVSGVVMKDISASGGGSFIASNSINNGNTSGWTFPPYTGQNLYWVGGSGNWNDKNHWSQTSGGIGGACVPGPGDNVFFDGGSGFTSGSKTISVDNVSYCHNITFSGSSVAPTILSSTGANTLNIYGSSEWQSGMTYGVVVTNYQNNNEPRTIKSNGVITGNSIVSGTVNFYETQSISLLDDFSVKYHLYQYAGTWNTNNYRVDIGNSFVSQSTTQVKTINLGSSNIYMNGSISSFDTRAINTVLNSGTSVIHFTAVVTITSSSYGIMGLAGQTYYDVVFENALSTGVAIGSGGTSVNPLNFHHVELKGGGYIYDFNKYNQFILAPGKTFYLENGTTQTITSLFSLNTPLCGGWSTFRSMSDGSVANISMPSGSSVQVSGVVMKDISASGGGSFIASNSINNGNTSGWTFPPYTGQNLYWVGGSGNWNDKNHWSQTSGGIGGACVPGPGDNVFFDGGSGFTSGSKTISVDNVSYCHNITFSGSSVAPTILSSTGANTLNIYGSSEWQSGMTYGVVVTNYQNNNEPRTIKSNGVITGNSIVSGTVNFYETQSISLLDDFSVKYHLYQYAGTWNTNNYRVDIGNSFVSQSTTQVKTINLGSSNIYMNGSISSFDTRAINTVLNSGTSVIHFTAVVTITSSSYGIMGLAGQTYYDVVFENALSTGVAIGSGGTSVNPLNFHHVEIKGGGYIYGFNKYNQLTLTAGKSYIFAAGSTQTVTSKLYASGNPCYIIYLLSSVSGTKANLNIQGGSLQFDFGNVKDINAIQPLHYGEKSTNAGNNTNIIFDPYNSGSFKGLGNDWICHEYDNSNSDTYTLSAESFFPNPSTTFVWTKIGDSNNTGILGTGSSLDLRPFGYGTYQLAVTYSTLGSPDYCTVTDQISISRKTSEPIVDGRVCKKANNTLGDIIVSGQNIKWYADGASSSVLPLSTVIGNGQVYYVTRTDNNCESNRLPYTIKITNCKSQSMINPALPFRTR